MFLKTKIQLFVILGAIGIGLVECASVQSTTTVSNNPPTVSYETHIKSIIKNYCLTCHDSEDSYSGIDLTTYESVKAKGLDGTLLKRINSSSDPMPPMGLLPKEDRQMIEDWVKNDYMKTSNDNSDTPTMEYEFNPPAIQAIDIEEEGFDFMEQMQGHWVGKMNLMGKDLDWFAFDYRPISASHIHGIFEGGSVGNLFTSFFVANYKGTKTIMARNGGILAGIYRTSYFVLEKVKISSSESYYRFVDAYGGKQIMWMELHFKKNKLEFNSYTSRMGTYYKPRKHMVFKAEKMNPELAKAAADAVGFPKKIVEKDFADGMPMPDWGSEYPVITSASYVFTDLSKDLVTLGKISKDPIRIDEMPYLSKVNLKFNRTEAIKGKKISFYLSKSPLTDDTGKIIMEYGYIKMDLMNQVLLFPEVSAKADEFELTYLHPGDYYLTAFIDENGDYAPSKGDLTSKSQLIKVTPNSTQEVVVLDIDVQN